MPPAPDPNPLCQRLTATRLRQSVHSDPARYWPVDPPPAGTHISTSPGLSESEVINSQGDRFKLPAAINRSDLHINMLLPDRHAVMGFLGV